MLINSNKDAKKFMDEIFFNSIDHDFGSKEDYRYAMWGHWVVLSGKRPEHRIERKLEANLEGIAEDKFQLKLGTIVDPKGEVSYKSAESLLSTVEYGLERTVKRYIYRLWDKNLPQFGHTFMTYPDPVTNKKLVDIDKDELRIHNPQLAQKFEVYLNNIMYYNKKNEIVPNPKKFTEDFLAVILDLSDTIKSNLNLSSSTNSFFTGNGIHVYMDFKEERISDLKDNKLVCTSNNYKQMMRILSMNLKYHMQIHFPLQGWDDMFEAFRHSNPAFYKIKTSERIEREFNDFITDTTKTTQPLLENVLKKYHRSCIPSSSVNREYLLTHLNFKAPDIKEKAISEAEEYASDYVAGFVEPKIRYEVMRKVQGQYTLSEEQIYRIARGN